MLSPSLLRSAGALLSTVLIMQGLACSGPDTPNQTIRNAEDVFARGSSPSVADSVAGDVMVAGGEPQFNGSSGGDYLGVGGKQTIHGRIHGSIRAAGGEVNVAATVDRNATIAGGSITLDSTTVVNRSAYLAGGNVRVDGMVRGALRVAAGTVVLNGLVGGDVEVRGGELRVGPRAQISGNLRYQVPKEKVHIDRSARIGGTVTALPLTKGRTFWPIFAALFMLGFLVAGGVVVALLPRFAAESAGVVGGRPGTSVLVGLGWICLVPLVGLLLCITLLGIPLAILLAFLYFPLLYLGRVPVAIWIGQRILGQRVQSDRRGTVWSFLAGGFVLFLLFLVPGIGPLLIMIATAFGLGAILLRAQAMRAPSRPG